jgi:hypothetical protein
MKQESRVSLFRNYFNPDPVIDMTIDQFCDYIQNSPEYVKEITALRSPEINKAERDKIKATLPAVTCSGTFTKRNVSNLIQHSSFICLDFDAGKNPDVDNWQGARDYTMNCENVYFSALSASGQGVFCLVPIAYPHLHSEQAKQLLIDFAKATGLKPDISCKDVSRLRGISWDPDAKYNKDAIKYYGVYREPEHKKQRQYRAGTRNDSPLEIALRMIREAEPGDRHDTILRASVLVGGYIAAGRVNEHMAQELLLTESREKLPRERHREAEKTIQDGIKHGKMNPVNN